MARSVWKGPFVELSLLKKAEAAQDKGGRAPIKAGRAVRRSCRSSSASPSMSTTAASSCRFRSMRVGMKLGEFAPTRTFHGHASDRKGKR